MIGNTQCKASSCKYNAFLGGYCKGHQYLREDIAALKRERVIEKSIKKRKKWRKKYVPKTEEELKAKEAMFNLFIDIWNERGHYSELSGFYLGAEPLSIYFHHILPKLTHPEYALDRRNIIVLTFEEHQDVEKDPNKFPTINRIREELLTEIDKKKQAF